IVPVVFTSNEHFRIAPWETIQGIIFGWHDIFDIICVLYNVDPPLELFLLPQL
ncbi:hypothetical protein ACJX0J_030336, partial [Zea mays]